MHAAGGHRFKHAHTIIAERGSEATLWFGPFGATGPSIAHIIGTNYGPGPNITRQYIDDLSSDLSGIGFESILDI